MITVDYYQDTKHMINTLNRSGLLFSMVLISFIFISGCANVVAAREPIDSNNDGAYDIWQTKKNDRIVMTEVDKDFNGEIDRVFYWDKNGYLTKEKFISINYKDEVREGHYYYHKYESMSEDGIDITACKLDVRRTYSDARQISSAKESTSYVSNYDLLYTDVDLNRDGIMDQRTNYKHFRPTSQKELN